MQTEAHIIKGCQKNIKSSQFELVKRYSGMLMTVSRRYTPDAFTAKDVLQEALILIFKNIHRYQHIGSFEGWMRTITIRVALQLIKKNARYTNAEVNENIQQDLVEPFVYSQLKEEYIIKLIQKLPTGFRTVFNLNIIEGYSHKEISDMLGITESTSRSQLMRARKLLQKQLHIYQNA